MKATAQTRKTRGAIYGHIKVSPWSTVNDIHEATKIGKPTIRRHIGIMMAGAMLQRKTTRVGRYGWAPAYARAGLQEILPDHTVMIGAGHYTVETTHMYIELEGQPASLPGTCIPYTRETVNKFPLSSWRVMVVSRVRLAAAHDPGPRQLTYFDPGQRIWFSGMVELFDQEYDDVVVGADPFGEPELGPRYVTKLTGVGHLDAQWV